MMTEYYETIHDISTDTITQRPYTDKEIEAAIAAENELKAKNEKLHKEQQEQEAARQALLDKLGITADEAKLLLG